MAQSEDNVVMSVRIPKDLRDQLEAIAKREERSINGQMLVFLRKAVKEDEH